LARNPGIRGSVEDVLDVVRAGFGEFTAPIAVIVVDVVPRTPSGETDFHEVRQIVRVARLLSSSIQRPPAQR
jgi:acyl-CoA synthetase (AMP-forming)/AMP-acid ligase II